MARKDSSDPLKVRGFNDIVGIVLLGMAFLLFVSLFSYDARDLSANQMPPNDPVRNWIGSIGAWTAYGLFCLVGGSAYMLPVFFLVFCLAFLFRVLSYLRHRWPWALVLVLVSSGVLDLYSAHLETLEKNLNTPAGGFLGVAMNNFVFEHLGIVGATTVFIMMYVISLYFLTNFHLGLWFRAVWQRYLNRFSYRSVEERLLEKQSRQLEKEAKKLERRVNETGPSSPEEEEFQNLPEPTVRDMSMSQSKPSKESNSKKETTPRSPVQAPDFMEGEVISAKEVAAATKEQVLGKNGSSESEAESSKENGESDSAPRPTGKPKSGSRRNRQITVAAAPQIGNYRLPSHDFLHNAGHHQRPTETKEELMANARLMQTTLSQFGINVALGDITKGPTITRYELHPAPGVKLERISNLSNNIAAALRAERINILAPVPGKSSVGVEVPNRVKTKVIMRDLLESEEWKNSRAKIPLALGKDVYGTPIVADLADMPHLLIAGSTGSGKSVCINSIVASLLYRFPPDELRFVMIDPKVVELQQYNGLPHLVVPVVNDPKKVVLALRWVVNEMEKRYQIFAKVGVRNIKSFNERPRGKTEDKEPELPLEKQEDPEANSEGFAVELDEEITVPRDDDIVVPEKLSYIVVIIDELADLMLVAPADVEMAIARITQMARAAGIHCIVATQRPSVDVITGVIKANIPARIAFQVASKVDSRTILDGMGADKLLGKGDMLYLPPGSARLVRIQGALITDQEIQDIVDYIRTQGKPSYEMEIHQQLSKPVSNIETGGGSEEDEELIQQCIDVIRSEQKASVSLLQRRLRLGYTRAARIMDELEDRGIVGPSKGAEPRDILIDLDGTGADGSGR